MVHDKVRPRKLPPIRWVMPPNPDDYRPQPPPDPENLQGICVTIDEVKFAEFIEELKNGTPKDS